MKKIGGNMYIHISQRKNLDTNLRDKVRVAENILRKKIKDMKIVMQVAVIKIGYRENDNKVSFILSPNFDTQREPEVGDAYMVDIEKKEVKLTKSKGQIYHHKWMFVDDAYTGFDVEASKKWSEKWESTMPRDKQIKSRIGYKKYWNEYLEKYNLEVE